MWNELKVPDEIGAFLAGCDRLSDGTLRAIHVEGAGFVGDTAARLVFENLDGPHRAIEIRCEGVTDLRVTPSPPGSDSVISGAVLTAGNEGLTLSVNFVGGPMKGPPNSVVFIPDRDFANPNIVVSARAMAWRTVGKAPGQDR
jgi:hypothetical protein